ncbi:MAG TPA: hypothetical protein VJ596_05860 [Gemmatimonadaceae bacterium]|nr:hypothetical protein [Gemmatimonadaceae bacterium]
MPRTLVLAAAAVLVAAEITPEVASAQSGGGYSYTFRSTSDDDDDSMIGEVRVLGDRTRIDFRTNGWHKKGYLLLTEGGRRVTLVDPRDEEYRTLERDSFERVISTAMRKVDRVMTMTLHDVRISTERLGGGGTVAGYATEHYRLVQRFRVGVGVLGLTKDMDQEIVTEFWVAPRLALPANPLIELLSTVESALAQHDASFVKRSLEARRSLFNGTPLRIVVTSRLHHEEEDDDVNVRRIEITEIGRARVDPEIFQIPRGYDRKDGWRF